MKIKVAIADDHLLVINGLQKMLAAYEHIEITSTYLDGDALLQGLQQSQPDVLLLDIQLPGKTGYELAPILLKSYPDLRILTLTNFDNIFYIKNMLHCGVLGYILKNTDMDTLVQAIESVYGYKEFLEPSIKAKIDESNSRMRVAMQHPELTPREQEILQLIANGKTSIEIGEMLHLGRRTVENYRFSMMLKLDAENAAIMIKKAVQWGLVK